MPDKLFVMSIRTRIFLGFLTLSLPLLILLGVMLYKTTKVAKLSEEIGSVNIPSDLDAEILEGRYLLLDWVLTGKPETKEEFFQNWDEIKKSVQTTDQIINKSSNDDLVKLWKRVKSLYGPLESAQLKIVNNPVEVNNKSAVSQGFNQMKKIGDEMIDTLDGAKSKLTGEREGGLYNLRGDQITESNNLVNKDIIDLLRFTLALLGLTVLLSILVPYLTARSILNPLNKAIGIAKKISAGERDIDVIVTAQDETGNLLSSLKTMQTAIKENEDKIKNMIVKVKSSANNASQSITSEASAIQEISASLEEIDKSSKQTMAKAQALREAARNTKDQGKLGTDLVTESIDGIKVSEERVKMIQQTILNLSNHTQQIGEITGVVNTLAQQLKMLALNAAIEASKAGEAGKGFAAVATEVRNLAEQSENSTEQVQKILEDIRFTTEKAVVVTEEGTKALNAGSKMIEKTGDVIKTLSKMIDEASISSQQIEAAIRQEAIGIEQIVESMNEINQATITLADGVNETNAFVNELDEIAQHRNEEKNTYKVSGSKYGEKS